MACSAPQIDSQNASSSATTGSTSSSSTVVSRTPRFTMEGVGARVIRGPDWKWGKQVKNFKIFNTYHHIFIWNSIKEKCKRVCIFLEIIFCRRK